MSTGLINPLLIKSNLLMNTINYQPENVFNIDYKYLLINFIIPMFIFVILCIYLKSRYKNKLKLEKQYKKNIKQLK